MFTRGYIHPPFLCQSSAEWHGQLRHIQLPAIHRTETLHRKTQTLELTSKGSVDDSEVHKLTMEHGCNLYTIWL